MLLSVECEGGYVLLIFVVIFRFFFLEFVLKYVIFFFG